MACFHSIFPFHLKISFFHIKYIFLASSTQYAHLYTLYVEQILADFVAGRKVEPILHTFVILEDTLCAIAE